MRSSQTEVKVKVVKVVKTKIGYLLAHLRKFQIEYPRQAERRVAFLKMVKAYLERGRK